MKYDSIDVQANLEFFQTSTEQVYELFDVILHNHLVTAKHIHNRPVFILKN